MECACCVQVITVADFHPRHCHTFAFATSKGAIRMADLRTNALLDNACKVYEEVCPPSLLQHPLNMCWKLRVAQCLCGTLISRRSAVQAPSCYQLF